jgi:hypothetical protein
MPSGSRRDELKQQAGGYDIRVAGMAFLFLAGFNVAVVCEIVKIVTAKKPVVSGKEDKPLYLRRFF